MKEKIMRWNYKKAFITIVVLAVVLALVSVIAVPLSLSQQIRDAHAWEQTLKTERLQSGENQSEHAGEREHGDWEKNITPLSVGHFVLFGSLIVLWRAPAGRIMCPCSPWLLTSGECSVPMGSTACTPITAAPICIIFGSIRKSSKQTICRLT